MKKLIYIVLLAAILLTGCRASHMQAPENSPEASKPVQTEQGKQGTGETEQETSDAVTEATKAMLDTAEYVIQKEDRSIRDEDGELMVDHTYDLVVLQGDAPSYERINEYILEDCEKFFSDNASYLNESDLASWPYKDYGNFICTAGATVVNNQNGIFSIKIERDWFMGGVFNADFYGLTYNLYTGEPVKLEDLSDLPADQFEQQLKDIAEVWLYDTYGEALFYPPLEVLDEYGLEDFLFYVEDGQIILTFPTYTFTAGAAGASIIPTGIMI